MSEHDITVSAIIPTYNRANIVIRAIQSVLNQTYQNFELLVIDDGSQDNTEEIVTGIHDNRIKYIRHEKNKGVAAARNTGIEAAKGEFIAFLDSDDEWLPNKLKRIRVRISLSTCNCPRPGGTLRVTKYSWLFMLQSPWPGQTT